MTSPRRARRSAFVAAAFLAAAALARPALADELFATVDRTAAPGERTVVKVRADAKGPVTLVTLRVEDPAALLDAGVDLTRGDVLHARLKASIDAALKAGAPRAPAPTDAKPGPDLVEARLTFVGLVTADLKVSSADAQNNLMAEVEVPLPAPGLYLIEVRKDKRATLVSALSSRLALVTKRHPAGMLAWAVDRTSGAPVGNVAVEVRAAGKRLANGTTDGEGLCPLAFAGSPTTQVRAALGDDLAFGAETYFPANVTDRRVYAFPHQPAYRPGERVEVKGVVRAWTDGRYVLDAGAREAVVRFLATNDKEIGRVTAPISPDLGTFSAGLDLPKDVPLGRCALVAEVGGKAYEAPFEIQEYKKPTFEVSVEASAPRALVGAPVTFDVEAAYYEGGPVASAPVAWSLVWSRVDRELFPTDELQRLFFGTEREAYAPEVVAQGNAVLDAQGRLSIPSKVPDRSLDGWLLLRATVTAPDRTAVAGSGGLGVDTSPVAIAIKTDKHLYGAEGVAHVTIKAALAGGAPAPKRRGVVTAALVVPGPTAGIVEEKTTGSYPFETGEDGNAVLDVPFGENGRYALSATLPRAEGEPAGAPAHATLHVWVAGERADVGFSGDRLEVVADKDAYAVGETARLLVLSPAGARPFLSTVEGARLESWKAVPLGGKDDRGSSAVVEVKIGPDHVPNAYLGVALVDHGNLLSTAKLLRVPPVERLLKTEVVPEKAELDPGSSMGLTVRVTDAAGKPAAGAEVSLAIVDDSLFALYADPAAAIEPFFYPVHRNDVRTGGPIHNGSVGFSAATPAEIRLALGETGGLAEGSAPAAGGSAGGAMPPAPAMPPPASPVPRPAEAPGRDGGPPMPEPALACGAGKCDDPRGIGGAALREEAEKLDKDGKGGGEGPLTARADFRTSIFWAPTVRVGEDGTAVVPPVKFAESLTRWRITARSVDAATRVGTSISTVRTVKKVLTRVTLPRFLRATDRVEAPWVLHSQLPEEAKADFTAAASGTSGLRIVGPSQGSIALGAGKVVVQPLSLEAPGVGDATVTAELRTPAGSDAVRATIPVLPQGIPKTLSATAIADGAAVTLPPLSLPSNAEGGTPRLRITVAPSYAQAVGAALPYLVGYPYGCTEQTMSRLVPVVVAQVATTRLKVPARGLLADLPKMLEKGLARLSSLQHADGGFGWWENDASDPYMTAYVLHGLSRALPVAAEKARVQGLMDGAARWLVAWTSKAGDGPLDARYAFALMALADADRLPEGRVPPAIRDGTLATDPLVRAFLVRASLASKQRQDSISVHLEELKARAIRDADGVHWGGERGGMPERWADDAVETTAWVLGAILAADPRNADLVPGARWLLSRRVDGQRWRSTRDTAAAVAFLTRYVASTGDLGAGRTVHLTLNGLRLRSVTISPENAFTDEAVVEVGASDLPRSAPIELRAEPEKGAATVTASLSFTETGPAIGAASSGFTVERTYWRLEAVTGPDGKVSYARKPWTETVPSGTLIDVDVGVTVAEGPKEFVMVTDPHVAGLEAERDVATPVKDAPPAAEATHVETRDDRTVFFATTLPAGTHVFRHRMRATHVGSFTALPAQAELMYFPDVRGNSKGESVEVSAAAAAGTPSEGGR